LRDQLAQPQLELRGDAEARSVAHHSIERVEYRRGRVAKHERAPREDVVDVFVAIDVPDARARASRHDERLATDSAKRAHRRADAARKELLRPTQQLVRAPGRTTGHRP